MIAADDDIPDVDDEVNDDETIQSETPFTNQWQPPLEPQPSNAASLDPSLYHQPRLTNAQQDKRHEIISEKAKYKHKKFYGAYNSIAFGRGKTYCHWGAFCAGISALMFSGGIVIICVQKFHRWTGFTDKMEFLGPCCLALFVALLGVAMFLFYKAQKLSNEDRQNLRMRGLDTGRHVELYDSRTKKTNHDSYVMQTGKKTDRATEKPLFVQYPNAPNRVYFPSQVSSHPSSTGNWARTVSNYQQPTTPRTNSQQYRQYQPGPNKTANQDNFSRPSTAGPPAPPATPDVTVDNVSSVSSAVSKTFYQKSPTPNYSMGSLSEDGRFEYIPSGQPTRPSATTSQTGGHPSVSRRTSAAQMPISHQMSSASGVAGLQSHQAAKLKIGGMSSLGDDSST